MLLSYPDPLQETNIGPEREGVGILPCRILPPVSIYCYNYIIFTEPKGEMEIMGYPTKVQMINRKKSRQFYVNFPSACAQMMDLRKGETVEWEITSGGDLILKRPHRQNDRENGGK